MEGANPTLPREVVLELVDHAVSPEIEDPEEEADEDEDGEGEAEVFEVEEHGCSRAVSIVQRWLQV